MEFLAGIFFVLSLIGLIVAVIGLIAPSAFKYPKTGAVPTRKAVFGGGLGLFFVCTVMAGVLAPEPTGDGVEPVATAPESAKPKGSEPVKQAAPPEVATAETKPLGPKYTEPSQESLKAAKVLIGELDDAKDAGAEILISGGDISRMGAHSRYLNELNAKAEAQFGATIFEPIGRCGTAASWARAWWHAQMSASGNGGIESTPGSIKSAYEQFVQDRRECLKNADPVVMAKENAELDAELKKKFGGGRECLSVLSVDPKTKEIITLPKPAHCKIG